jgi:hypothetical protein
MARIVITYDRYFKRAAAEAEGGGDRGAGGFSRY